MRTAWFIDGPYLFRSAPFDFEFAHLRERIELRLGYALTDCFFFQPIGDTPPVSHNEFSESVQSAKPRGAQARLRYVAAFDNAEAAIASAMSVALVSAAVHGRYEKLVLSTPHGYYADALAYIRDRLRARATLAVYQDASAALHPLADGVLNLDELWDDVS